METLGLGASVFCLSLLDVFIIEAMLEDSDRVAFYKEAIRSLTGNNKQQQQQQQQQQEHLKGLCDMRVLEIGCGPLALLSLLAIQQGAPRVDALEVRGTINTNPTTKCSSSSSSSSRGFERMSFAWLLGELRLLSLLSLLSASSCDYCCCCCCSLMQVRIILRLLSFNKLASTLPVPNKETSIILIIIILIIILIIITIIIGCEFIDVTQSSSL